MKWDGGAGGQRQVGVGRVWYGVGRGWRSERMMRAGDRYGRVSHPLLLGGGNRDG